MILFEVPVIGKFPIPNASIHFPIAPITQDFLITTQVIYYVKSNTWQKSTLLMETAKDIFLPIVNDCEDSRHSQGFHLKDGKNVNWAGQMEDSE